MMKPNSDEEMDIEATSQPEVALAKGVLIQAKQDLRRFAAAQDSVGREMYADAYSWVAANTSMRRPDPGVRTGRYEPQDDHRSVAHFKV